MIIPETYFSFSEQTHLFLVSCLAGIILGIIYDIFRTFRILFPHNSVLVIIEDIIFSLIYIIFIVSFFSSSARGEFRVFYILGNILGFILYFFTVGKIVISIIKKLVHVIHSVFSILLKPFYLIYVMMCKKISNKFGCFYEFFLKHIKIFFLHLIDTSKMLYNDIGIHKRKNVKNFGSKKESKKNQRKKSG